VTNTRISKTEDVVNISRVLALSWKTAYRGIVHDEYLDSLEYDHWVEFLTTGLGNGSIFSMVIEDEYEIIGAAVLCKTEKENEANLKAFYLLPDKIGRGFGHTFLCSIESELRKMGFRNYIIDVLGNNSRAIRFYDAHGFTDTGKNINTTLGERHYTCKSFEKAL